MVGNDGEEDVSVVESRVGLKRLDVCYECDKSAEMNSTSGKNLALPNQSIVTKVFQHCGLGLGEILNGVFLLMEV